MTIQTNRLFDYKLNEKGVKDLNEAKAAFGDFQENILGRLPAGRNGSIVKTKLEEASFYMSRAIAEIDTNHSEITTH
jgi:hypothetical protein